MKYKESEKILERKLSQSVSRLGGWSIKLAPIHVVGLPDRLCLLPRAKIFFAEIKSTGDKPTKIQKLIHKRIRALGFRVEVIDTTKKLNNLIREYE